MRNTIKIQKAINKYKAYIKYVNMVERTNPEHLDYYGFYKFNILREIAQLKASNPKSYKLACALDRLILS